MNKQIRIIHLAIVILFDNMTLVFTDANLSLEHYDNLV